MKNAKARYELFYWPSIQGRGEFVRLALEDAGAAYVDVARAPGGVAKMMQLMNGGARGLMEPFAPPFLRDGKLLIAQTANVLLYLGPRVGLAPKDEGARLAAHQIQLTISDCVAEAHESHHPISVGLYYEDQKTEAKMNARAFVRERIPKFLGYFERVLVANGGKFMIGRRHSYADLSTFQLVEGLSYAFPRAMKKMEKKIPRLFALRDRVMARPRMKAYLASERRLAFNEDGIFRHYPELDS